jgi:hypothetical protein
MVILMPIYMCYQAYFEGPSLFHVGDQRINRRPVPCCGPAPQGFLEW